MTATAIVHTSRTASEVFLHEYLSYLWQESEIFKIYQIQAKYFAHSLHDCDVLRGRNKMNCAIEEE